MDPRVAALRKQLRRLLRTTGQLFYAADSNRDDKLNFEEFSRGVAMMGIRPIPSHKDMRLLFDAYDTDQDGWIQWSELRSPPSSSHPKQRSPPRTRSSSPPGQQPSPTPHTPETDPSSSLPRWSVSASPTRSDTNLATYERLVGTIQALEADKRTLERQLDAAKADIVSKDEELIGLRRLVQLSSRSLDILDNGEAASEQPTSQVLLATIKAQDESLQALESRAHELALAVEGSRVGVPAVEQLEVAAVQLQRQLGVAAPDVPKHSGGRRVGYSETELEALADLMQSATAALWSHEQALENAEGEMDHCRDTAHNQKLLLEQLQHDVADVGARNCRLEVENQLVVEELLEADCPPSPEGLLGHQATHYLSKILDGAASVSTPPPLSKPSRYNPSHARSFGEIYSETVQRNTDDQCVEQQVKELKERFARAGVWLPLEHLNGNVYRFQKMRKLALALQNGQLVVRVGGGFQHLVDYLWDRLDKQYPLSAAAARNSGHGSPLKTATHIKRTPSPHGATGRRPKEPTLLDPAVRDLQKRLRQLHRTAGQLFYASDGNRDNKLNLEEFSRGVAMMGVRPVPQPAEMRALFDAYDGDDDGWIQWSELNRLFGCNGNEHATTGNLVAQVKSVLGSAS